MPENKIFHRRHHIKFMKHHLIVNSEFEDAKEHFLCYFRYTNSLNQQENYYKPLENGNAAAVVWQHCNGIADLQAMLRVKGHIIKLS